MKKLSSDAEMKDRLMQLIPTMLAASKVNLNIQNTSEDVFSMAFEIQKNISGMFSTDLPLMTGQSGKYVIMCNISFYRQYECPIISFAFESKHVYKETQDCYSDTHRITHLISNSEFNRYRKDLYLHQVLNLNTSINDTNLNNILDTIEEKYSTTEVINTIEDII